MNKSNSNIFYKVFKESWAKFKGELKHCKDLGNIFYKGIKGSFIELTSIGMDDLLTSVFTKLERTSQEFKE